MKTHLSPDQIESLGAELDAIRAEVVADLGERDAAHIRGMVRLARWNAIAGRGLLMFGIGPVSWAAGASAPSPSARPTACRPRCATPPIAS